MAVGEAVGAVGKAVEVAVEVTVASVGCDIGGTVGCDVGGTVGCDVGGTETDGDAVGWSKTSPCKTQKWSSNGASRSWKWPPNSSTNSKLISPCDADDPPATASLKQPSGKHNHSWPA